VKSAPRFTRHLAALSLLLLVPYLHGQQPPTPSSNDNASAYKRHINIPMPEAGPAGLDGWLVVPHTAVKPPLLLLTDGSTHSHLRELGPGNLLPEALWFVRRGWAVAIISRRGTGLSGGADPDEKLPKMPCSEATFEFLQGSYAQDLRAAYTYLATQPDVDATRTIAAGYVTAGSAAMWLTAAPDGPPVGLKAVINFSGGWSTLPDWMLKGNVHAIPDAIVPSFAKLGAAAHVPMLWLYPKKGSVFGLKSALAAKDAFSAAGGVAEMDILQHSGDKDHYLFDENPAEWGPLVEQFLAKLGLPSTEIIPQAPLPDMKKLPSVFSDETKVAYLRYLEKGPNKAFAYSSRGAWGYASGKLTLDLAEHEALANCAGSDCKVIGSEQWR
jgi:dienelactone hydrolase